MPDVLAQIPGAQAEWNALDLMFDGETNPNLSRRAHQRLMGKQIQISPDMR